MPLEGFVEPIKTPNGWAWRGNHRTCPREEKAFRVWASPNGEVQSIEKDLSVEAFKFEDTDTHKLPPTDITGLG